ncbi:MAG: hypothetical protein LYZ66_06025 [Nitrososphaerales archaeon]|nr:hypothetical protein [Nitrososphaerales archaeon]
MAITYPDVAFMVFESIKESTGRARIASRSTGTRRGNTWSGWTGASG